MYQIARPVLKQVPDFRSFPNSFGDPGLLGFPPGKIIMNGLVLNLESANLDSYPGAERRWADLSGNQSHVVLQNNIPFNLARVNSFNFNGTNQWGIGADTLFPRGSEPLSICCWARASNVSGGRWIFSYGPTFTGMAPAIGIFNATPLATTYNGLNLVGSRTINLNEWLFIAVTMVSNDWRLYLRNELIGTQTAHALNTSLGNVSVGRQVNGNEYWAGDIASVRLYNRALTQYEIVQNFQAERGFYGV